MSAIFGLVRPGGAPVTEAELARMQRTLAHRGPDGQAALALGEAGLGHCLMRVNREDRFEAQPLHDRELGITMVADLRLDNREELAGEVGIDLATLVTLSDSAVLLEAWRKWGVDCLEHLLGDFVIAVWDHRHKRLHLARDGMGQRGLYFHRGPKIIAFASEIKALWAIDGVPRELNEAGLARHLLGPVDADPGMTLFTEIEAIPGGCIYTLPADGHVERRSFWRPQPAPEHLARDDAYYIDAYRRIVTEAIACRVRRLEHPPGLMFSGGVDSGTIAAIAAPVFAARGQEILAVASVLPEGDVRPLGDARRQAQVFAETPGMALDWYALGEESVFDDLEQGFAQLDDCRQNDYVRRAAYAMMRRHGSRLVMDGHGGDYTVNMLDNGMLGRILLSGDLRRFLRELAARRSYQRRSLLWILAYDVVRPILPDWLLRAGSRLSRRGVPLWRTRMTCDDFAGRILAQGRIDSRRLRDSQVTHGRWEQRWLHMLNKISAASPTAPNLAAQAGLMISRPFHDRRVVELGLAIPQHLQFRDGTERWLARQALRDVLPQPLLASGPANAPERPGHHAMIARSAPAVLDELEPLHDGSAAARYVDLGKVRSALKEGLPDERRIVDYAKLSAAANGLTVARFVNWFNRMNNPGQEP